MPSGNAAVSVALAVASGMTPNLSCADEGGVSFWLPGQMASFAASQGEPGWSVPLVYYHTSVDAGGGYTYLNAEKGREFSVVGGLTYNFENEDTNYQNGVDSHIDWALSQFLNEEVHVGLVGYVYQQLSGASGSGAVLGDFKSRVYAIGPQAGYFFPFGSAKGYVNLRGYFEFDASHRIEGWNTSLTLSLPF